MFRVSSSPYEVGRRLPNRAFDNVLRELSYSCLTINFSASSSQAFQCLVMLEPDASILKYLDSGIMNSLQLIFREKSQLRQAHTPTPLRGKSRIVQLVSQIKEL